MQTRDTNCRDTNRRVVQSSAVSLVIVLLAVACASRADEGSGSDSVTSRTPSGTDVTSADLGSDGSPDPSIDDGGGEAGPVSAQRYVFPDAPPAPSPDAPSNDEADAAIERVIAGFENGLFDIGGVTELAPVADVRHLWVLSDLLRFAGPDEADTIVGSFETVSGVSIGGDPELARSPWSSVTNHLIAWDTPAYPGYQEHKAGIYLLIEDRWEPFFTDEDADIDFRYLSWGGVFMDVRQLGDPEPCVGGCIPALDDPDTTDADGGDWYPDDRTVFGIEVDGESLAIPLNIAEIHEMFNLTLGGRRLGIPYCTLCGSAQAFLTDDVPGVETEIVLRTSGLLSRSNKVMYDLITDSAFDTFTGHAVTGPLQDSGVVLDETTVVRSTWAKWKEEHPDTRIIAEDGGIGRGYSLDPLGGRDDDGPIFPIGDADPRLGVQEFVVGVITADGTPVAFPSLVASDVLADGGTVELGGVELRRSGDGLIAVDASSGDALPAHEAFWFAWSQFHPETLLWPPA